MPTLSDAEMAALKAELAAPAYAGLDAMGAFEKLHAPGAPVRNPVATAPTVPKPFTWLDFLGLLSAPSLGKLDNNPNFHDMLADISAGNRAGLGGWAAAALDGGAITQDEHDKILALISATVADPSWTMFIPGPSPKMRLFGAKTWTMPHPAGTDPRASDVTIDFVPLADLQAAMGVS